MKTLISTALSATLAGGMTLAGTAEDNIKTVQDFSRLTARTT